MEINGLNSEGCTALLACCQRAYNSGNEDLIAKLESTKQRRYRCCKLLIEAGADVDLQNKLVEMTALHWAAYNDDS